MVHVAGERFIYIADEVCRHDHDPSELFQSLKEIVDFSVGVTVAGIINLQSLAQQGIDLVE